MFPSRSSNASCNNNPFSYTTTPYNHDLLANPSINNNIDVDESNGGTTTFSQHGFPNSTFLDQDQLFTTTNIDHHDLIVEDQEEEPSSSTVNGVVSKKLGKQTAAKKRASGKKDRHSKIYTAQGPRDRRMRLSLQIARKFFDLQDTLGFDKASRTIEWLFTKSKTAIRELMSSSTLPHDHDQVLKHFEECQDQETLQKYTIKGKEVLMDQHHEAKNERKSRNTALSSKDCRDKARARARERTRDKMWRSSLEKPSKQCCFDANPNYNLELGPSSTPCFDLIEESSSHSGQDMSCSTLKSVEEEPKIITDLLEHQMATVGIMDKLFGMRSRDPGTCFTDDFLGFQQDWAMGTNARFHSDYGSTPNDHIEEIYSGDDHVHQHQNPSSSFKSTSHIHLQPHFLAD